MLLDLINKKVKMKAAVYKYVDPYGFAPSLMFYHVLLRFFPSLTFESRGRIEIVQPISTTSKNDVRFVFAPSCLHDGLCLIYFICFLFAAYSGVQHVLTI